MKKVLLDENLPIRLKHRLIDMGFDAQTVREKGWNGILNGALLALAVQNGYDIFLTADKNLPYQQSISGLKLTVLVLDLPSLNYTHIQTLLPEIKSAVQDAIPSTVVKIP